MPPSQARTRGCVLLTGFDAFGGERINPSWQAVRALHDARIGDCAVVARQLPTSFAHAPRLLRAALRELNPVLVLCVGQAGGRAQVSLERVAINVCDARSADNDGATPCDVPVLAGGPDAYFSRLPLRACLGTLHAAGIPAEISNSAGTFVCNQVMYVLLHALRARRGVAAGFVHVPWLPQQALAHRAAPSMSAAQVRRALRIIIASALQGQPAATPRQARGRKRSSRHSV